MIKRKLLVGATGLAVLAGTGGAYAATQTQQGTSPTTRPDPAAEQKAFLDDVAKRLNVTRDKLDEAIKGAASARIDAAVAAGHLTKEQGDAIKKRIASGTGLPLIGGHALGVPGPGLRGHLPGGPGGLRFGFGAGKSLTEAAKYLGLTEAQLRTELKNGKSLAAIAKDKGKTTDGLKAAMKSAITTQFDQAVKDKKLTAEQRTELLKNIDERLDNLINNTRPERPRPPRWP